MDIAIAGIGGFCDGIEKCIKRNVNILYYIDNDISKRRCGRAGKNVCSYYECSSQTVDYVVVAIMAYEQMRAQLLEFGFSEKQIICFFDDRLDFEQHRNLFRRKKSRQYQIQCSLGYLKGQLKQTENREMFLGGHYAYEIIDQIRNDRIELPKICSVKETCKKIISERVSMSRYGDGEFEIIFGRAKDVYQDNDVILSERLQEILQSEQVNHIVALADDYGQMKGLREESKNVIRRYMTEAKRLQHYSCLKADKQYYNAYISRPYVIYPHEKRDDARKRFEDLKSIWNLENVLVVEGDRTRMGVGNDLLSNALSVERVIAPSENAFLVYDVILSAVRKYGKGKLILAALGPTATVLAYDLAREGYWILDIGHLDLEYEWFLKGQGYSYIPHKYNNEMPGDEYVVERYDQEYEDSICERIR